MFNAQGRPTSLKEKDVIRVLVTWQGMEVRILRPCDHAEPEWLYFSRNVLSRHIGVPGAGCIQAQQIAELMANALGPFSVESRGSGYDFCVVPA
jgi:hypothetical protein